MVDCSRSVCSVLCPARWEVGGVSAQARDWREGRVRQQPAQPVCQETPRHSHLTPHTLPVHIRHTFSITLANDRHTSRLTRADIRHTGRTFNTIYHGFYGPCDASVSYGPCDARVSYGPCDARVSYGPCDARVSCDRCDFPGLLSGPSSAQQGDMQPIIASHQMSPLYNPAVMTRSQQIRTKC